jgi:hypothetical protein
MRNTLSKKLTRNSDGASGNHGLIKDCQTVWKQIVWLSLCAVAMKDVSSTQRAIMKEV